MGLSARLATKTTALGAAPAAAPQAPATTPPQAGRYLEIDPRRIEPNPDQPRREFDQAALERLAASITEHGLLEPLLVRLEAGRVILIAGERRQRACILAGLTLVPCTVSDRDPAILALVENLHRQDLSPMEEAGAYARLQQERGLTLDQLADLAKKAKSTVSEILSLNKLASIREIVVANPERFPQRVLVEMSKQEPSRIEPLAQHIVNNPGRVSVEALRGLRRAAKPPKPPAKPQPPREGDSPLAHTDALIRRAEQLAGELAALDLDKLNYRQRTLARQSLQPMARALDRAFHYLKRKANEDANRWTPERRAKLLRLVQEQGQGPASRELGHEIDGDGHYLHPSELAEQLTLARREYMASQEANAPGESDE